MLLDKQKRAPAAPVEARVPVPAPAPVATVEDPVEPHTAPVADVQTKARVEGAESASASLGRGLRIGGLTLAALGAVGIATGVVFNLKANGLTSDLEAANGSSTTLYSRSKESSRSTYETAGWIAYGAGVACLAGGAILYYLGHRQSQSSRVAFVPTIAAGHVGAALQGAF